MEGGASYGSDGLAVGFGIRVGWGGGGQGGRGEVALALGRLWSSGWEAGHRLRGL